MQGGLNILFLEKMNMPLNERVKYVINTVNYLLNNHHIGKLLEEIIVFKILHSSFFLNFFFSIKFYLVYYLLIPTAIYIENTMIVQGDTVMYKISNNQQLQTFRGTQNNYNSEGEDPDYINDLRILNNQQLRNQYYKTFTLKTQDKFNTSLFNLLEIQKILESFGPKCDECKQNKPFKNICCENNHKVYYFYLIFI
jgi:hypothetical protein